MSSTTLTRPTTKHKPSRAQQPVQPRTRSPEHDTATKRTWVTRLIATDRSYTSLILRLTLAVVMFPHGAQKLLGWFGGTGLSGTMSFFTETLGLPLAVGALVILSEFFGSIALAFGMFGRVAAAGVVAVMLGAIFTVHLPNGFFMNWSGTQVGEGFEFHLLAIGAALAVLIAGSGAFSLDRLVARKA